MSLIGVSSLGIPHRRTSSVLNESPYGIASASQHYSLFLYKSCERILVTS